MGKNHAEVKLTNQTGEPITNVSYMHRYDHDVKNLGSLTVLEAGATAKIGIATYWTGFGRTGLDFWWIQFERGDSVYTCKDDFYCYLTAGDAKNGGPVILMVTSSNMNVAPPVSSACSVKLHSLPVLLDLITEEHVRSGIVDEDQPEDPSKKCSSIE